MSIWFISGHGHVPVHAFTSRSSAQGNEYLMYAVRSFASVWLRIFSNVPYVISVLYKVLPVVASLFAGGIVEPPLERVGRFLQPAISLTNPPDCPGLIPPVR